MFLRLYFLVRYGQLYLGSPGNRRVVRGGSWNNNQNNARAAYRNHNHPDNRNNNLGFRLVRRPTPQTSLWPVSNRATRPHLTQGFWTQRQNPGGCPTTGIRFQFMPADSDLSRRLRDAAKAGFEMAQAGPACTQIRRYRSAAGVRQKQKPGRGLDGTHPAAPAPRNV